MEKRGNTALEKIANWIIAIFVLVIVSIFILAVTGGLDSTINYLKDLFRFR